MEKRAVRRLEHERKAMEESFKRFDEKARNDAFKHEQAKLAHEAAKKKTEKRKELIQRELHETVGAEKREDVTKPVEAAKTKEEAKIKKALKALTAMKTLKVTKQQTVVKQQNVANEQHDAKNIQSSQEDAAKEPTKNVQSPVSSDLETPKRSPHTLAKKQPLSPLNKPAAARTSSDSGHSSPITIPTRTSSRFASTGFTSLFSSETERTSRSTSVSTTIPPANPADPAGECPTEEARAPSSPPSAVAAAAEEGEEVYFTAEEE
jgi:hypothetical protein